MCERECVCVCVRECVCMCVLRHLEVLLREPLVRLGATDHRRHVALHQAADHFLFGVKSPWLLPNTRSELLRYKSRNIRRGLTVFCFGPALRNQTHTATRRERKKKALLQNG